MLSQPNWLNRLIICNPALLESQVNCCKFTESLRRGMKFVMMVESQYWPVSFRVSDRYFRYWQLNESISVKDFCYNSTCLKITESHPLTFVSVRVSVPTLAESQVYVWILVVSGCRRIFWTMTTLSHPIMLKYNVSLKSLGMVQDFVANLNVSEAVR